MSPTTRRWIFRTMLVVTFGVPLSLLAFCLVNPFGVHSLNPRDRLTGHGVFRIPGEAMAPTLKAGQIVFADMRNPETMSLARGDIALFYRSDRDTVFAKRIIGLPGESLAINQAQVRVDGRALAEPYVDPANAATDYSLYMGTVQLGQDEYFLMGDNRDNSDDSRASGPVHRDAMRGKLTGL